MAGEDRPPCVGTAPGVCVQDWGAPSAFLSQSLRIRNKTLNGKHLGCEPGMGGWAVEGERGGPCSPSLPLLMHQLLQVLHSTPWSWAGRGCEVLQETKDESQGLGPQ